MTEKKWTIVWPTTWQLIPIPLVWLARNWFILLSDLQLCGNSYYDLISFILILAILLLPIVYAIISSIFLFRKKIAFAVQVIISLLIWFLPAPNSFPSYRIPMIIDNFYKNEAIYERKVHNIIGSGMIANSDIFEYYDAIVPDNKIFCYQGVRILRNEKYLFILLPIHIYNEMSKHSYFQGYLYSLTGEYPENIFPREQTNLLKKLNSHWYLIYEAPPDRTRSY